MIDPTRINSFIFDFDGTLCSGRYFASLGEDALDAIDKLVFGDNSGQWADPWMRGDLTSQDIASYLSKHLPESRDGILSALREGCSCMTLNPAVYDFALQQREGCRKTALVTANMDIFTEVIVPAHNLETVFDVVLSTSNHRTLDKSILWRKALSAFGTGFSFASTVLIEDSPRMISLFESLGGYVHKYQGDQAFRAWLDETGFTR